VFTTSSGSRLWMNNAMTNYDLERILNSWGLVAGDVTFITDGKKTITHLKINKKVEQFVIRGIERDVRKQQEKEIVDTVVDTIEENIASIQETVDGLKPKTAAVLCVNNEGIEEYFDRYVEYISYPVPVDNPYLLVENRFGKPQYCDKERFKATWDDEGR